MNYHPGTIYIDQEAVNLSFTKAITAQYPQIDPIIIDPREVKSKLFDQVASLTKGKQILYLKKFQKKKANLSLEGFFYKKIRSGQIVEA